MYNLETNSTFFDKFKYTGKGMDYFKVFIVNAILSMLTLGIYYSWAKVNDIKFHYNNTTFKGSSFEFHGKGMEILIGFLKFFGIMILLYAFLGVSVYFSIVLSMPSLIYIAYLVFMTGFFVLLPIAVIGALKYRTSRSSWRGIFFGYEDNKKEFIIFYFTQLVLIFITLLVYSPWATCNIYERYMRNLNFGDARFSFDGDGLDLLKINVVGILLSVVTLGLYLPFFVANRTNYILNQTYIHKDDKNSRFVSNIQGIDLLVTFLIYGFISIITLGFALPWFTTKLSEKIFDKIAIEGDIDFDTLNQGEYNPTDATGDSALDYLDAAGLI